MSNKLKTNKKEVVEETTEKVQKPFWKKPQYIIMMVLIVVLFIFNLRHTFVVISGNSMNPNFEDGNVVLANRQFELQRFDVIVANVPECPNNILIKRVIGMPGDHLEYVSNKLFVNGEYIEDPWGFGNTDDFSVDVPADAYFCIGDNREHSGDSRMYGAFNRTQIFAKVTKLQN